ncbi:hypothetical protein RJ639_008641 [Escallonia herrerae]|uniref:Uncharacterized protein n=1 Tax=Escallonia herrerae TaxID=1293975 RepID=A0AA88VTK7_9ASTE|nr:hypothetical protein RJ639_008641 [Escallonia herrerae]
MKLIKLDSKPDAFHTKGNSISRLAQARIESTAVVLLCSIAFLPASPSAASAPGNWSPSSDGLISSRTTRKYLLASKNCFAWIGPVPRLYIMEPKLITEVHTNNHIFKKLDPNPVHALVVTGLSNYENDKWAKHRKIC